MSGHYERAHVAMAHNRIVRGDYGRGDQEDVKHHLAESEGFRSWSDFCRRGRSRILVRTARGGLTEILSGILWIDPACEPAASELLVSALLVRGAYGERAGPVAVSGSPADLYMTLRRLGVSSGTSCGMNLIVPAGGEDELISALAPMRGAHEGLIWIRPSWPGGELSGRTLRALLRGWPNAIIVVIAPRPRRWARPPGSLITGNGRLRLLRPGRRPVKLGTAPRPSASDRERSASLASLASALCAAGIPLGPHIGKLSVEDLAALRGVPEIAAFLAALPGCGSGEISPLARERLRLITMCARPGFPPTEGGHGTS